MIVTDDKKIPKDGDGDDGSPGSEELAIVCMHLAVQCFQAAVASPSYSSSIKPPDPIELARRFWEFATE